MNAVARREAIVSILVEDGKVRVADLAARLMVSDDTVRRDLQTLSGEGFVQKTHGGAIVLDVPSLRRDLRGGIASDAKQQIAQAAIGHLPPGGTLFIDAGQTALAVAAQLPPGAFSVITHSLDAANALSRRSDLRLIMLGGEWDEAQRMFKGPATLDAIRSYRADLAVMGACAIDPAFGVTASEEWDAAAKRAMLAASARSLLVADHTKLGHRERYFVAPLDGFDHFVTDDVRPARSDKV